MNLPPAMQTTSRHRFYEPSFLETRAGEQPKQLWLFVRWTKDARRRSVVEFGPSRTRPPLYRAMSRWIRANHLRQLPKGFAR